MTAGALGTFGAVRILAARELRERARTRGVRWGTVALVLIASAAAVVPSVVPEGADPEWTVAVTGDTPAGFEDALAALGEVESARVTLVPTEAPPDAAAAREDHDAVLVHGASLVADGEVPERLQLLLTSALNRARVTERLAERGVPPDEAAALLTPEPLEVRDLDSDGDTAARQGVALAGSVVLLAAILTYGSWVLYSVLEEKANRIVELVVSAVRPMELLVAKVVGIGLVGAAQMVVVLAAASMVAAAAGTLPEVPEFVGASVAATLVFFLLGFAFYALGYAAAGSLTTRQEDASGAASPLMVLVMVAYVASIGLVAPDPDATLARVVSFVPLVTPLAMPARIANDAVTGWEVAASVAVMLVAIWGMARLAATIYSNALLRSGGRVRALAALRGGER